MWVVTLMIPLKVFCNIRSIEKFAHLLIGSCAKKANLTGNQADLSITHFFTMLYDCI